MNYKADFKWPDGAVIAVVFNISWETWPKKLGTPENNQGGGRERCEPTAKYRRSMMPVYEHAFAETGGMQRLLDVAKRTGIKMSCYTDGLNILNYPDLAKAARDQGTEFLVQGWDHSYLWEQTVAEQTKSIDDTLKVMKDILGIKPTGFSASGGSITPETFDIVAARGMDYCCGFRNCDVPFVIKRKDRNLVGQNSYDISDYNSYHHSDYAIRDVAQMWKDEFDVLYDEGVRGFPKMLAYGTHPFLARGYRTRFLEELIRYVQGRSKVWITTRGEITQYLLKRYPDLTLDKFYPESAVGQDRWYGLSTGVGGAEADREARSYRVE